MLWARSKKFFLTEATELELLGKKELQENSYQLFFYFTAQRVQVSDMSMDMTGGTMDMTNTMGENGTDAPTAMDSDDLIPSLQVNMMLLIVNRNLSVMSAVSYRIS